MSAEHELDDMLSQKKKKKKKAGVKEEEQKQSLNKYDALHARLKLRRGLLGLFMLMKVNECLNNEKREIVVDF